MAEALTTARLALEGQIDRLARALKESPEGLRAAAGAAAPGALASLIGQGETEGGLDALRVALKDAQTGPELLTQLGERLDGARLRGRAGGAGTRLLGGRGAALIEQVASEGHIKPASASALVDLTATVLVAALRQTGGTLKEGEEVRTLLRRQAPAVNRALPDSLRPRFEIVLQPEPADGSTRAPPTWVWALVVLALVAAALLIWLMLGHPAHAQVVAGAAFMTRLVNARTGEPLRSEAFEATHS